MGWKAKAIPLVWAGFIVVAPSPWPVAAQLAADGEASEPAAAPDGPAGEFVGEILVVARRREENLQEVPISVTAFDETAIEERQMVDITDIGTYTPNVTIGTTDGKGILSGSVFAVIRGIGQLTLGITADPGVGLYVDGVFLARAGGGALDLLDVDRVEVLRGPQGTLFGKNTTGGAILILTKRPASELSGRVAATVGRFDRRDARLSVSGPLSEKLQSSLALLTTHRDGFSRSLFSGTEYNDDDREVGRVALRWLPLSDVTVDFRGDFLRERETGGDQVLLALTSTQILDFYNHALVAAGLPPATEELWATGSFYESNSSGPAFVDIDHFGASLDVSWLFSDSFNLRSISSYRGIDSRVRGDLDAVPQVISDVESETASDQVSQEVQLSGLHAGGRLSWVAGSLYFRETPRNLETLNVMSDLFGLLEGLPGPLVSPPGAPAFLCNPGPPPPGVPCFGGEGNPLNLGFLGGFGGVNEFDLETESWALFGEATYDVTAKLSATLGMRYSRDEKRFHLVEASIFGEILADLFNEDHWDAVTPRVSIAYQAKPEVLVYATAAKGYKSGGFNPRPQGTGVLQPYDPEDVWSYEAGWKSDLLGGKLRWNGAAFWSDYANIHFNELVDIDGAAVFLIQNAGEAEIRGFELELEASPAAGLNISANLGFTDTKLVEVDPGVAVSVEDGVSLPKAPEWSASFALQYAFDLADSGALIARTDYTYLSKVYNDLVNSEAIAQDPYGLWNLHLSWSSLSGRWEVAGFVTNLTDEEYLAHGWVVGAFGFDLGVAGSPRQWGLKAQWRF